MESHFDNKKRYDARWKHLHCFNVTVKFAKSCTTEYDSMFGNEMRWDVPCQCSAPIHEKTHEFDIGIFLSNESERDAAIEDLIVQHFSMHDCDNLGNATYLYDCRVCNTVRAYKYMTTSCDHAGWRKEDYPWRCKKCKHEIVVETLQILHVDEIERGERFEEFLAFHT